MIMFCGSNVGFKAFCSVSLLISISHCVAGEHLPTQGPLVPHSCPPAHLRGIPGRSQAS